ncbi:hypothetical protein H1D31_07835 [Alishewanella sp. BS5-314]|uniref:hypothetical protein n=1 Tax=Alishewanella sp. BS5-314 TaxID=2755587 RepID=UPI0021BB6F06|nr:hypothetical protein [Alishewanella sp. BS5-314]MCT8125928.1 hypothetical protein [Alishewanella sp. BS5-314]
MRISVGIKSLSRLPYQAAAVLRNSSYPGLYSLIIDADETELDQLQQQQEQQVPVLLTLSLWQAELAATESLPKDAAALNQPLAALPEVWLQGRVAGQLSADTALLQLEKEQTPLVVWFSSPIALEQGCWLCVKGELHATPVFAPN